MSLLIVLHDLCVFNLKSINILTPIMKLPPCICPLSLLCESVGESVGSILVPMILDLLSIQRTSIAIVFVGPLSVVFAPIYKDGVLKRLHATTLRHKLPFLKESCCVQKAVKRCICGLLDISVDVCIRNWTALHVFTATTVLLNRSLRENLDCIPLASSTHWRRRTSGFLSQWVLSRKRGKRRM